MIKTTLIATLAMVLIAPSLGMACGPAPPDPPAPDPEPSIDISAFSPGMDTDADANVRPNPDCTWIDWIHNQCGEELPNVPAE